MAGCQCEWGLGNVSGGDGLRDRGAMLRNSGELLSNRVEVWRKRLCSDG